MTLTLWAFIARAQSLFPVKICHFIVMGNHIHFLIYVENPEDVERFMNLLKTDIAHMVNRIRGRRKRTVWCKSFDCVPILTLEDAVSKIAYIYTNPQKANLEKTIEDYPGVSSWGMFTSGLNSKELPALRRSHYSKLDNPRLTRRGQKAIAEELEEKTKVRATFTLEPDAWMKTFGIKDPEEKKNLNRRIVAIVREKEEEYEKLRIRDGKPIVGRDQLIDMPLDYEYEPTKFSKRMWCICSDIPKRVAYILWIKKLLKEARDVRERWRIGDYSVPYPLGLFPPRMLRRGNLVPGFVE
jgi:REP element-mobilizing transposase RayT